MAFSVVVWAVLMAGLLYALWSYYEARREGRAHAELAQLEALGDVAPATLHPEIDPLRCIGSGACVISCPEHSPLALVQGRARLVNPLGCIGHGACESACPAQAIRLVFGTKTRGVELPKIDPNFQTNQPGIYIAGELGGMGLIKNAVAQGAQAATHVLHGSKEQPPRRGHEGALDALVIGAGPAGISATLKLMEGGLNVLLIDREVFGGTVAHYPRAKVVMTGDLEFPLFGRVKKRTMSKENLLELWDQIRERCQPPFETGLLVERIEQRSTSCWVVHAAGKTFETANVILALGMRGSPRKLGVPGEELPKVHYRLLEPAEFAAQHVLVVGGGNSAVETALSLADFGGCASVSISYRKGQFARCRLDNQKRISAAIGAETVRALMPTEIVRIEPNQVWFTDSSGATQAMANHAVIAQIGGTAPSELLRGFGIELVTKYGER